MAAAISHYRLASTSIRSTIEEVLGTILVEDRRVALLDEAVRISRHDRLPGRGLDLELFVEGPLRLVLDGALSATITDSLVADIRRVAEDAGLFEEDDSSPVAAAADPPDEADESISAEPTSPRAHAGDAEDSAVRPVGRRTPQPRTQARSAPKLRAPTLPSRASAELEPEPSEELYVVLVTHDSEAFTRISRRLPPTAIITRYRDAASLVRAPADARVCILDARTRALPDPSVLWRAVSGREIVLWGADDWSDPRVAIALGPARSWLRCSSEAAPADVAALCESLALASHMTG